MLSLRRKPEAACFTGVRPNDRVQLDVAGRSYLTRVEDVLGRELHVATPLDEDWLETSSQHDRAVLNVFSELGFRRFAARIAGFTPGRVPLVVLAHAKYLGSLDRRCYDRVAAQLPVKYRAKVEKGDAAPWRPAATSDVSGNGLRLVCSGAAYAAANEYVDVQLYLAQTDNPVEAVAQLAWMTGASKNEQQPSFGLHFVVIHHADRARIVDYVKGRRALIKSWRRRDGRAPTDMPVKYRVISGSRIGDWHGATTSDVSASGLRIVEERGGACKSGDRVDVELTLPGDDKSVRAAGKVAWKAGPQQKGDPSMGVHFEDISIDDRKRIAEFVRRKLESFQQEHNRLH
jgi:c-di-GMP-binding flagellar brake protein YcgR